MVVRFSLDRRFSRPVFYISIGGGTYRVLFDTGAFYPVYTGGNEGMELIGGRLEQRNVSFGDFSGRCVGDLSGCACPSEV